MSRGVKPPERGPQRQATGGLDEFALATAADDQIERLIIDYVDARLANRREDEDEVGVVNELPPGMRALYLTWTVESEVINGGFVRYFWNWAGQFADDAVAAFEFFSAREHSQLMREANRVYAEECGTSFVSDGRELIDAYESWRLQLLEDCFYQLDESLSALRIDKIREHPEAFCGG
ncbi:MAG TPA: DUF4375 domain-containing protein [Steroidobacter sp.]|uniref:DMP19 family protein n=1 Tax=Steroidobacter sp. TaxID=1978227 RepID=UPI002ED8C473